MEEKYMRGGLNMSFLGYILFCSEKSHHWIFEFYTDYRDFIRMLLGIWLLVASYRLFYVNKYCIDDNEQESNLE